MPGRARGRTARSEDRCVGPQRSQWMPGRARGRTHRQPADEPSMPVSMDALPSARADVVADANTTVDASSQWMPGRARGRTWSIAHNKAWLNLSQWMPGRARGRTGSVGCVSAWIVKMSQWMPGRARGRTNAHYLDIVDTLSQWMPGRARGRTGLDAFIMDDSTGLNGCPAERAGGRQSRTAESPCLRRLNGCPAERAGGREFGLPRNAKPEGLNGCPAERAGGRFVDRRGMP